MKLYFVLVAQLGPIDARNADIIAERGYICQAKKKPYSGIDEQVMIVVFHFPFAERRS